MIEFCTINIFFRLTFIACARIAGEKHLHLTVYAWYTSTKSEKLGKTPASMKIEPKQPESTGGYTLTNPRNRCSRTV